VRFLVDAQLPRRLARELNDMGHDAIHTLDLPKRNATPDGDIANLADHEGRVVVTKDVDFLNSHLVGGTPRRLLRVLTGNISNPELLALFEANIAIIEERFADSDLIELSADTIVSYPRRP
jgi:predicted nuclease of predicted toxin-antitoxin system